MATPVLVPINDYLKTPYDPDVEFVDGELKERTVGEGPHAELQAILSRILGVRRKEWNLRVLTEQRVQTSGTHFRIPDVCLVARTAPRELIVRQPPLLCVEILSYEDRLRDVQEKVDEFAAMGVKAIWVLDPWKRIGYLASARGFEQPADGVLRVEGTAIALVLAELFAELDEE